MLHEKSMRYGDPNDLLSVNIYKTLTSVHNARVQKEERPSVGMERGQLSSS